MSYFKNSRNSCHFIGRLGKDVETKDLEGGLKVSKFSIATTQVITKKDEENREATEWIPCEIWGDHPALPYLTKGKEVSVEAQYKTSKKGEGEDTQYFHVFRVHELILLSGGSTKFEEA